jgi:hypothetical protein
MQVQAQNIRPGDRIRGIGLTVDFSEPFSDWVTNVEGTVSTRNAETGEFEKASVEIKLPNTHLVNVRRPFQPTDRVTVPLHYVLGEFAGALEGLFGDISGFAYAEVDEVRPDERQVVVFDPLSSEPLEERDRVAIPFNRTRHATPEATAAFESTETDV